MTPTGKLALFGGLGLTAAGLAYYFFVYRKNQANAQAAFANINSSVQSAQSKALFQNLTLADLKAKIWANTQRQDVSTLLRGYDPSSGLISHANAALQGILLDANTIQWTASGGQTDIWKGYPRTTVFPSKAQLLASLDTMNLGGDLGNYKNAVNSNYDQSKGHFQMGGFGIDVVSIEPIVVKASKAGSENYVLPSKFYVSQHPELAGLSGLPTRKLIS
jgi:hypothetical protein